MSVGIYLENVSNGYVMYSEFYNNGFFGIEVINSTKLTIWGNNFHDNLVTGVYFGGVSDSTILENHIEGHTGYGVELYNSHGIDIELNNISFSGYSGIYLVRSNSSDIASNRISYSSDGIALVESTSNELKYNTIKYSDKSGILIHIYSHYNSITNNVISNALSCILIGNSSHGTYLENNEPCTIQTYEDVQVLPPPPPDPIEDESLKIPGYFLAYTVALIATSVLIVITTKKIKVRHSRRNIV